MNVQDAIPLAQSCGGLLIPRTETHFVDMMMPTAKRHMVIDGKVAYQGHKWQDALSRFEGRGTYVDIGAHCALWAWFLSMHFKRTVAFEAAPLHAALFRANIEDIQWKEYTGGDDPAGFWYEADTVNHGHVTLHEVALGAERGTIAIECAADETGSAHVAQGEGGDKRRGHAELITYPDISMFPLDDFKFEDIDFCKIDVEGYELQVVQGAEQTFKTHKPWLVVEQKGNDMIYGGKKDEAVDLLKSWGWKDEKVISGDHCMSPPA